MAELWNAGRCAKFLGYSYDYFRKVIRHQEGVPRLVDPARKRICGVYFLFSGDEIVYVGQSVDVLGRVPCSLRKGSWKVTGFSYIECAKASLSEAERGCILSYRPKWNLVHRKPGFIRVPSLTSRTGSVEVRLDGSV